MRLTAVRKCFALLGGLLASLAALAPAHAQVAQTAKVVASCGNQSYTAGTANYVTVDTTGKACSAATSTPSGTADVNLKQVNGVTVNVGVGAASTGTQRVAVSTDSSIIANATAATFASSSALAANQVVKASAGTLYSFSVSATPTLYAAPWWVMIYNATAAPSDGAVTPAKCYAMPAGATSVGGTFGAGGLSLGTGITIGVSTTGCFAKTASTQAFISGDYQ